MLLKKIPNILSIFRILVSPFMFYFIIQNNKISLTIAFVLFLLGSVSDALDGYIARTYNVISNLGKNLDPIADKIFMQASFFSLYIAGNEGIKIWMLFLILFRDVFVTFIRYVSKKENITFNTSRLAKNKTFFQAFSISSTLLIMINSFENSRFNNLILVLNNEVRMGDIIIYILIGLCSIFTFYTGLDYYFKFLRAKNEK